MDKIPHDGGFEKSLVLLQWNLNPVSNEAYGFSLTILRSLPSEYHPYVPT